MHPDLATVKELQDVDRKIGELTSRIQVIPVQIKKIEDQLNESLHAHDERKNRLASNQKERRDLEGEIQLIKAKITKHRDQLYEVKTNEAYRTMLHEIEGEDVKVRSIEDRILEKMSEAEQLEKYVHDAAARLDSERSRVAAEKKELEAERRKDEVERDESEERRRALASGLSNATLQLYERARKARGTAVVAVVDGSCSGCHVKLRPQFYNEVRGSDALLTCESCGRILYYLESPVDKAADGTRVVM
ncbi:MAG TPA: C4-type zinc ribbon domain-containing protein [Terriglobia bacterium]